jgi:hypothetical protein
MNAPSASAPPWYRQRWPWLLMLGPAIVVVAGLATLAIAVRSDDGLVADDYYKRGLAINQTLERSARAAALGLSATIDVDAAGNVALALATQASDPDAHPPTLRLRLAHPTRAGADRATVLVQDGEGRYVGRVAPGDGRWRVIVETDRWRLPGVESRVPVAGLALDASDARQR